MRVNFSLTVNALALAVSMSIAVMWQGIYAGHGAAAAPETAEVTGTVSDADGRAVEGAMVFIYGSPEVRRSAEFISAPTDRDGRYRVVVTAGKYWAVARLKKTEGFGPLMPGDRHSGEPVETEIVPGKEVTMDFTVTDLREAMSIRTKEREEAIKISGRIVDEKGAPVRNAYAIAHRMQTIIRFPEYLSSWVDEEGRYTLYAPRGTYFIGTATTFPPEQVSFVEGEMTFDEDRADLDIVLKSKE